MEGVRVGRSGLQVSRLCLGTMIFGSQREQSEAFAIMDMAAELGIDFIDVADVYPVPPTSQTWGRTEEIVGAWLQGKRDGFVVATKCVNRVGPARNDYGGSRKHVIEACETSLRRLELRGLAGGDGAGGDREVEPGTHHSSATSLQPTQPTVRARSAAAGASLWHGRGAIQPSRRRPVDRQVHARRGAARRVPLRSGRLRQDVPGPLLE